MASSDRKVMAPSCVRLILGSANAKSATVTHVTAITAIAYALVVIFMRKLRGPLSLTLPAPKTAPNDLRGGHMRHPPWYFKSRCCPCSGGSAQLHWYPSLDYAPRGRGALNFFPA